MSSLTGGVAMPLLKTRRCWRKRGFRRSPTEFSSLLGDAIPDPLLDDFWPRVLRRRDEARTHGMRFSLARREIEATWGVANLEVPLSEVCQTDGFYWFVSHLLAQLPRYRPGAQRGSRRVPRDSRYPQQEPSRWPRLRRKASGSRRRSGSGEREQPRRRPLLVRQRRETMDLRIAGEDEVLIELPLAPEREACCAVERLRELPALAVRLRTRALTTTLFSRFLLGDLFIHGIGGAKYDELGDEIARRFFGIEPPGFLTVSMTLWLGLPAEPASAADLADVNRAVARPAIQPRPLSIRTATLRNYVIW